MTLSCDFGDVMGLQMQNPVKKNIPNSTQLNSIAKFYVITSYCMSPNLCMLHFSNSWTDQEIESMRSRQVFIAVSLASYQLHCPVPRFWTLNVYDQMLGLSGGWGSNHSSQMWNLQKGYGPQEEKNRNYRKEIFIFQKFSFHLSQNFVGEKSQHRKHKIEISSFFTSMSLSKLQLYARIGYVKKIIGFFFYSRRPQFSAVESKPWDVNMPGITLIFLDFYLKTATSNHLLKRVLRDWIGSTI